MLAGVGCGHGFFDPQPPDAPVPLDVSATPLTFVQSNYVNSTTAGSYLQVRYPLAQHAGDLDVLVVEWSGGAAINTVSDSAMNTYSLAAAPYGPSGYQQEMFYAAGIADQPAGMNDVTVVFDTNYTSIEIRILEYSGIDPASPFDVAQSATAASGDSVVGLTTNHGHELLIATNTCQDMTLAAGAGYTSRMLTSFGNIVEDREADTAGMYDASAVLSGGSWVIQVAAFRGM